MKSKNQEQAVLPLRSYMVAWSRPGSQVSPHDPDVYLRDYGCDIVVARTPKQAEELARAAKQYNYVYTVAIKSVQDLGVL